MAEEGADMMFVTVFAGVLDLASGRCSYASAGHDSPFSLRAGAAPVQLAAEGGPPLGAVDDFVYPINHHRLEPGEMLLRSPTALPRQPTPRGRSTRSAGWERRWRRRRRPARAPSSRMSGPISAASSPPPSRRRHHHPGAALARPRVMLSGR